MNRCFTNFNCQLSMEPKSLYQAIVAHGKSFTIEEYCKYQIVNMKPKYLKLSIINCQLSIINLKGISNRKQGPTILNLQHPLTPHHT
jgi:hypothetical protein